MDNMKLLDFARIINKKIEIIFVPDRNPEFYATFENAEVKDVIVKNLKELL